jgi:anti-sigma B factor antagonist
MDIRQRNLGPVTVLDVGGSLVLSEGQGDSLLKETIASLASEGRRLFVVNLSGISQIDTAGLTMLVAAQIAVVRRGARVTFASPTQRLREIFAVTRLSSFFDIAETEADALSRLQAAEEM